MYGFDVRYIPLITNANTAFPLLSNNTLISSHHFQAGDSVQVKGTLHSKSTLEFL